MSSKRVSIDKKGFQITRLGKDDIVLAKKLFLLLQEIFEVEHPAVPVEPYMTSLLVNPAFICLVALYDNEIAGGLTAYELPMYHLASSEIFIYDIGVHAAFQRLGCGRKLLESIKEHARVRRCKSVFVDANEEDQHALDFYRSTGGHEAGVVQFTYKIPS